MKRSRSLRKSVKRSLKRKSTKKSKRRRSVRKVRKLGGYFCSGKDCFQKDTQQDDEAYRKIGFAQATTNLNSAAYLANTNTYLNSLSM